MGGEDILIYGEKGVMVEISEPLFYLGSKADENKFKNHDHYVISKHVNMIVKTRAFISH